MKTFAITNSSSLFQFIIKNFLKSKSATIANLYLRIYVTI
jgi:hypothetical protein